MPDEAARPARRMEDRLRYRRWHYLRLLSWVVLVAAVMWGFHLSNTAIHRVHRETDARIYAACVSSNEARQGIQSFIKDLIDNQRQLLHRTGPLTPSEQHTVDLAAKRFHLLKCPPPVR